MPILNAPVVKFVAEGIGDDVPADVVGIVAGAIPAG